MVLLYWDFDRTILQRQQKERWGTKVIDRLSADLREAFPDLSGLSPRNLKYMRSFAEAWPDPAILQQVAAQIPPFHNCILLDKLDNLDDRPMIGLLLCGGKSHVAVEYALRGLT